MGSYYTDAGVWDTPLGIDALPDSESREPICHPRYLSDDTLP